MTVVTPCFCLSPAPSVQLVVNLPLFHHNEYIEQYLINGTKPKLISFGHWKCSYKFCHCMVVLYINLSDHCGIAPDRDIGSIALLHNEYHYRSNLQLKQPIQGHPCHHTHHCHQHLASLQVWKHFSCYKGHFGQGYQECNGAS